MVWMPKKIWNGETAFIIGGGPSLSSFDWNLLKGKHTIGCNDAYLLGKERCEVMLFSDVKWGIAHEKRLSQYKGIISSRSASY